MNVPTHWPLVREEYFTDFDHYPLIVTFQVENVVFVVSRDPFLYPGNYFEKHLKPPSRFGTTKDNPIVVPLGISVDDFRNFVRVMDENECEEQSSLSTIEEWRGVLHLATKWDFPMIRRQAIAAVGPMIFQGSLMEKLYWVKTYQIKSWFLVVYSFILTSPDPIPQDEMRGLDIGWEVICNLYAIREKWLAGVTYETSLEITARNLEAVYGTSDGMESPSDSASGSPGSDYESESEESSETGSESSSESERTSSEDSDTSTASEPDNLSWFGMPLSWARWQLEVYFSEELLCMRND
ncbi:hypothetical protein CVT24_010918 [Panaeolus cyanescens]|uniref:BTB domain-containing protein n=1 Tax=Panaeolus cyanescens TaxID=181874 RepID=A0A409YVP3_9AGAR|nr:hypothetical protein CVT24_010918 [Panaeolus cyanescens]